MFLQVSGSGSKDIEKRGHGDRQGHHSWSTKKILGFRWSKKDKITLETISFWRITSISIFKLCPFLHIIKAWWWNLFKFLDFWKAFRGDTPDFENARLIHACKWLQKIRPLPKSAFDFWISRQHYSTVFVFYVFFWGFERFILRVLSHDCFLEYLCNIRRIIYP